MSLKSRLDLSICIHYSAVVRQEGCQFLLYIAGMAMDEEAARSDVEKL